MSERSRAFADQVGRKVSERGGPLGRECRDVRRELFEADRPFGDEVPVDKAVADEDVHPGQQQRGVRAGLDGQPVVGLHRRGGEARIHDDQLRAARPSVGEILHHRVAGVLADVRADQDQAAGLVPIHRLVVADGPAEGEERGLFPRAGTERHGWLGRVGRSPRLGQIIHKPEIARRMPKERHGLGAMLVLDGDAASLRCSRAPLPRWPSGTGLRRAPRSRIMGCFRRSGSYRNETPACPRAQSFPRLLGSFGLPSILQTRPFTLLTMMPQRQGHISQ